MKCMNKNDILLGGGGQSQCHFSRCFLISHHLPNFQFIMLHFEFHDQYLVSFPSMSEMNTNFTIDC